MTLRYRITASADNSARAAQLNLNPVVIHNRMRQPGDLGEVDALRQRSLRMAALAQSKVSAAVRSKMDDAVAANGAALARKSGLSVSVVSRLLTGVVAMALAHLAALGQGLGEGSLLGDVVMQWRQSANVATTWNASERNRSAGPNRAEGKRWF